MLGNKLIDIEIFLFFSIREGWCVEGGGGALSDNTREYCQVFFLKAYKRCAFSCSCVLNEIDPPCFPISTQRTLNAHFLFCSHS